MVFCFQGHLMLISIIAAMDKNRLIGDNNQLPWHLPADLAHFKAITLGKPVIMGRRTFHSIGKPLPGRRNIVISKQSLDLVDVEVFHSLTTAMQALQTQKEIMIIGGAMIFEQTLPLANKIYLTIIDHEFSGDAFFPQLPNEWQEIAREHHAPDEKNQYAFDFVELIKN
jgi:dihydrofolate reductase